LYWYGKFAKGVFRGDDSLVCESIPIEDEFICFIGMLIYNEDGYNSALKDYNKYWEWRKNRNESRWASHDGKPFDYDCYLESETEFLTIDGWKRYDAIDSQDKLATINSKNSIEYQNFTNRIDKSYSGDLYIYESRYTRFNITENHNIYVSDCHRGPKNGFSTEYSRDISKWYLQSVKDFFLGRRSYKHLLLAPEMCNEKDYDIDDDLLIIMGLYISEGSLCKNGKGKVNAISISQVEGGLIESFLDQIKQRQFTTSKHFRKGRFECSYRFNDLEVINLCVQCGEYSENKTLPKFINKLSVRQMTLLFESMMSGDGHKHEKEHYVYYSCSYELMKSLQTMLFIGGFSTQIYGPYNHEYENGFKRNHPSYQLFFSKERKNVSCMCKGEWRPSDGFGWTKNYIKEARVVCFTVPNGTLITRNKDKIAIQGNCKNIMHCARLLLSGENILKNGEPIVRFEGAERDFLMEIRRGDRPYDDIMKWVDQKMIDLEELYNSDKCAAPDKINVKKIEELYRELTK
jgi:hypothetical protein